MTIYQQSLSVVIIYNALFGLLDPVVSSWASPLPVDESGGSGKQLKQTAPRDGGGEGREQH